MKFDYKLSIIIPCYNSSKTIWRTINSIVNNDLTKDEYEIVIADDNSTDNFMDIVNRYKDRANIAYYKVNTDVHCPGNTRQVGLENAKGEWITFIDHDDYFEPNIFKKVFRTIEINHIDTFLYTCFYGVLTDRKETYIADDTNIPWLHGKFYNHQMLLDGDLKFKKDLISHEDVYFNNKVRIYLSMINKSLHATTELFTYNWVQRSNSVSHYSKGNLSFLDLHIEDFAYANIMPFIEMPEEYGSYRYHFALANLMMTYFVYQQGLYRVGEEEYPKSNKIHVAKLKKLIEREFNVDNEGMLHYLYSDPAYYEEVKTSTFGSINKPFIEVESLRDFIFSLDDITDEECEINDKTSKNWLR